MNLKDCTNLLYGEDRRVATIVTVRMIANNDEMKLIWLVPGISSAERQYNQTATNTINGGGHGVNSTMTDGIVDGTN